MRKNERADAATCRIRGGGIVLRRPSPGFPLFARRYFATFSGRICVPWKRRLRIHTSCGVMVSLWW